MTLQSLPPLTGEFLYALFQNSQTSALLVVDSEGIIVDHNAFIARHLLRSDLLGQHIDSVLVQAHQPFSQLLVEADSHPCLLRFEGPSDQPIIMSSQIFQDSEKKIIIAEQVQQTDEQILKKYPG